MIRAGQTVAGGRVVVDTNVVSYMLGPSSLHEGYRELLLGFNPCVAFVTPEELYFGADKRGWGERRRLALEVALAQYMLLLPNLEVARISAHLRAERERAGRPMDLPDAWIAATALGYELPLVSHDGDFDDIDGLSVLTLRRSHRVEEPRVRYDVTVRSVPLEVLTIRELPPAARPLRGTRGHPGHASVP